MYRILVILIYFEGILGLVEQYDQQDQIKIEEDLKEIEQINKAKEILYKMKNGIGGVTVATHYPSGEMFIHRNKWMLTCNGKISEENGHCNGDPLQSVSAYRPNSPLEFCFVKTFSFINDSVCVGTHQMKMTIDNGIVKCESLNKPFTVYTTNIHLYQESCKEISNEVRYIYYANEKDSERVKIPSDNPYVKCDNEIIIENKTVKKHLGHINRNKYTKIPNKPGLCSFTENDKDLFSLRKYLQF